MRIILTAMLVITSLCLQAAPIDKIVSFGDSLSDNGNVYRMTTMIHKMDPQKMPNSMPGPPYYKGRFTNGLVWSEYLAQRLGLPLDKSGYESFAFAGSWAETPNYSQMYVVPDIATQVDWFLVRTNPLDTDYDADVSNHLFTFWDGSNDYLGERSDSLTDAAHQAVTQIETAIRKLLLWTNAKRILVLNLPNLGRIPKTLNAKKTEHSAAELTAVTKLHNRLLAEAIVRLKNEFPETNIMTIDIFKNLETIMDTNYYGSTHIEDVSHACYTGPKMGYFGRACRNPDAHLFWDDIHPTRVIANLIAVEAHQLLVKQHALY